MSPAVYFAIILFVKMTVTAGFVLVATIAAERAGPLVGGLIATLPIAAGPAYFFLALDHDASFIADSARASLAINPLLAIFAVAYAALAQRYSLWASYGLAIGLWVMLVYVVQLWQWTLPQVLLFNLVVLPVCIVAARPMRAATMKRVPTRWYDVIGRAVSVAVLVVAVVGLSFKIGPRGTGILAVFPIVLSSIIFIMHPRAGGKVSGAIIANTVVGFLGFGLALTALSVTAPMLGSAFALPAALLVSFAWGPLVLAVKRRGIPV